MFQLIPVVTYTGERLQIFGPHAQFGLSGSGKLRLAAIAQYRIGAYEEDDSAFLSGMGDRKDAVMLGLSLQTELPGSVSLTASYAHDALDEIGGGEALLSVERSFEFNAMRVSPNIGLNWLSSELANNDFGVPSHKATPARRAYAPGGVVSVESGVGVSVEIRRDCLLVMNAGVEFLDGDVSASPIVDEDVVTKGFAAISYLF